MKMKQFVAVVAATALFALTAYLGTVTAATVTPMQSAAETISTLPALLSDTVSFSFPAEPFLAEIDVVGTIQSSGLYSYEGLYDHDLYMSLVDALMDDPDNRGIFLYVDSPGGTVYESDELYLKLMEYRETTNRPIYAYFASEACSGGYYIAMAADEIYANRNAWTGSIGVIISLMNYQGLSEKIGVTAIDITAGRNKSMGSAWETLTDEQRGILQSLVDESYTQFVDIVAAGRKMERETVVELADGRIYSAKQALEHGLIDHIAGEEDALAEILEKAGLELDAEIYIPERSTAFGFLGQLFSRAAALRPKSELEIFREIVSDSRNGALMYYAG